MPLTPDKQNKKRAHLISAGIAAGAVVLTGREIGQVQLNDIKDVMRGILPTNKRDDDSDYGGGSGGYGADGDPKELDFNEFAVLGVGLFVYLLSYILLTQSEKQLQPA